MSEPSLRVMAPPGRVSAVVLMLHGGAERGRRRVWPWRAAYLRMIPLARAVRGEGLEVRLLRNRVYGWNAPALDPVQDARWALARIRAERPGLPVALVGHSMGARVALRVAGDPAVTGVCALAPWTPGREPVDAVVGRPVLIVHGTRDRITSPAESYDFGRRAEAAGARVARVEVAGDGHAMLRRPGVWTALLRDFARAVAAGGDPLADRHGLRIPG